MPEYDVCIVGAGPGGLTALSAILEPYSLDHLNSHQAGRAATGYCKTKNTANRQPRVCVIDPAPWLSCWKARFAALEIEWLRSPGVAHPDCFDMAALQSYAIKHGREDQMLEIQDAAKTLKALPEASAGMWRLPGNTLFLDFCDDMLKHLPHDFKLAKVEDIRGADGDFSIHMDNGDQISSSAIVLALGFPGPQIMPAVLASLPADSVGHTSSNDGEFLTNIKNKERVLVVGGGLTAVQAAQLADKRGCRTTLLSRRHLTTRHFDVDVKWFDWRVNRALHFQFLDKSPEERLDMIKATRGGGSVPPMYMKDLKTREASGRLNIINGEIESASQLGSAIEVCIDGKCHTFDKVVCACGHRPDCTALPLTRLLHQRWPTKLERGFPVLSQDLQWEGLRRLFVIGALSSLQVGPDAGNLMGLRRASQVVVSALDLRGWIRDEKSVLSNIRGNRFSAFCESDSEEESSASEKGASSCDDKCGGGRSRGGTESTRDESDC